MKKALTILTLSMLSSLVMHAQSGKNSLPKTSEQKEIKATNYLKKEIEMKQLTAPPERIADSTAAVKTMKLKRTKNLHLQLKGQPFNAELIKVFL